MKRPWILFLLLILILSSCSPAADANPVSNPTLSLPSASQTPPPPTQNPVIATATSITGSAAPVSSGGVAVILVEEGDVLNIRSAAGIANPVIEDVAANAIGLSRTGGAQLVGDETWAEVQTSTTAAGWVNARYLTEYVQPTTFCLDPKVQFLL